MVLRKAGDPDGPKPEEEQRLVCGACQAFLDGPYPSKAFADQAADEHAIEVHGDEGRVVVIPFPAPVVEEREGIALSIAVVTQRQLGQAEGTQEIGR